MSGPPRDGRAYDDMDGLTGMPKFCQLLQYSCQYIVHTHTERVPAYERQGWSQDMEWENAAAG